MPDENGPQPGSGQPRDPWAPPEQRPSLDKPAGLPHQGQPGVPPGGSVHEQPTVVGAPGDETPGAVPPPPPAPSGAVPPPPPAPGPYGYPGAASTPSQGAGPAAGGTPYPGGPGYSYPQYPAGPAPYPGPGWAGQPMPSNGMGIAAMVLGIVSVVGFCLYGIVGLVTGILAIIFGIKGRRKADNGEATNRGAATAGLILGWIGSVVGLLVIVFIIIAIVVGVHESRDTPFSDEDPFATSLVIQP